MSDRKKLDVLDGLRGFAILLVVLFHYRLTAGDGTPPTLFFRGLAPFRFGYSGVNLFLVLSGFCLTLSLLRRTEAGAPPPLRAYLVSRWRRIAPPFYAAAAVYLAARPLLARAGVPPLGSGDHSTWQVVVHALFLHGLWPEAITAFNDPFWSLSLEFQFYATLPLLFASMLRFGPIPTLVVVTVASWLWRLAILSQPIDRFYAINGFMLARWPEFAIGSAVAFHHARPRPSSRGRATIGLLSAAAPALLLLASWLALRDQALWSDYAYGLGYGTLLLIALPSNERRSPAAILFSARPLVWIGSISYSLYLTHSLFLALVLRGYRMLVSNPTSTTDALVVASALGVVLGGGWCFFQLVEVRSSYRTNMGPRVGSRGLVNQVQPA